MPISQYGVPGFPLLSPGKEPERPEHVGHRIYSRTIFKVPDHIRQLDAEAYEPVYAAIGPFHHPDPCKRTPMQDYKWRCLRHLLSRPRGSQQRVTEDQCRSKMMELDAKVRSSYSFDISYLEPRKLALIMLVDGCFVIHFLLEVERDRIRGETGRGREIQGARKDEEMKDENVVALDEEEIEGPLVGGLSIWNIVVYDLLKLENQIPFFVIQTLFCLLRTPRDKDVDLTKLALRLFTHVNPNNSANILKNFDGFNSRLNTPGCPIHQLLHLFYSTLVASQTPAQRHGQASSSIPSATELRRAGIKIKKNENAACFLDITFEGRSLAIPPLQVHDYTNSLLRNLIAFEQCYPDTRSFLTWYAGFMDCVIDTAADAHLLHMKDIVHNELGYEEAVASLFNQLRKKIHYDPDRNYLNDQFVEVNNYYNSKYHKRKADFRRTYCSSPWAFASVVAAVLLFLLTIEQAVFAALSYWRQ